jgi:hypothetical protein
MHAPDVFAIIATLNQFTQVTVTASRVEPKERDAELAAKRAFR